MALSVLVYHNHQSSNMPIDHCKMSKYTHHLSLWSWMKFTMMGQSLVMENRLMTLLSMTAMALMILSH